MTNCVQLPQLACNKSIRHWSYVGLIIPRGNSPSLMPTHSAIDFGALGVLHPPNFKLIFHQIDYQYSMKIELRWFTCSGVLVNDVQLVVRFFYFVQSNTKTGALKHVCALDYECTMMALWCTHSPGLRADLQYIVRCFFVFFEISITFAFFPKSGQFLHLRNGEERYTHGPRRACPAELWMPRGRKKSESPY